MSNPPLGSTSAHNAARSAQQPPAPPPRLIQPRGENVALDSFANIVNRTATPFMQAPPAHQGTVGYVNQALGGVLGLINAPVELLNTGFALATNRIAAFFPAKPAATLTAMHVGIPHPHGHPPSLIPPVPPIPLPSIGTVEVAGCQSVLINGKPAARSGDVGLAFTCITFTPPLEVFTGSSKVFIGGSRAARMGDLTKHCIPSAGGLSKLAATMMGAGLVAGALGAVTSHLDSEHSREEADASRADAAEARSRAAAAEAEAEAAEAPEVAAEAAAAAEQAKAEATDAENAAVASAAAAAGQAMAAAGAAKQLAGDAVAMALSLLIGKDPGLWPDIGQIVEGSPNVLIGGFPMPSWSDLASGVMKLVKGLRRGIRGGRKQGRLFCARCM